MLVGDGDGDLGGGAFDLNRIYVQNYLAKHHYNLTNLNDFRIFQPSSGSTFAIFGDSDTIGYVYENIPFIPQKGDEIRMMSSSNEDIIFTCTSDFKNAGQVPIFPVLINRIFTASVSPNPQDFKLPSTSSFTIRRKIDQDNKVILKIPFIEGTLGITTPSSDGFLIPDDFTQDNKDKVGKLIAILKGNNVFD